MYVTLVMTNDTQSAVLYSLEQSSCKHACPGKIDFRLVAAIDSSACRRSLES